MKINFKIFYFSIFFTLLLLAIYGQHSLFHKYLGQISPFEEVEFLNVCNETHCRGIIYNLFTFILYNGLGESIVIIFFQIFLFVFFTLNLIIQMKEYKINKYLLGFFLIVIFLNPKLIKYSFNFGDEAILIPLIIIYFSYVFKFFKNRSLTNYFLITFITILLYLTKSGTAPIILNIILYSFFLNSNIKKKITYFFLSILLIIVFHQLNTNLINSIKNEKNYYLHVHLLSSIIAKSDIIEKRNNKIDKLINTKITRKNIINEQISKNFTNKMFYKCVIFPALNNIIYDDLEINNFFEDKKNYTHVKDIPLIYFERFFAEPVKFISHYLGCTFSNFIFIEFVSKKNFKYNLKLMQNESLTIHEKKIINSFIINSEAYFDKILYARIFGLLTLIIMLISFFVSFSNLMSKKTDELDLINLLIFFTYISIIFIHVNIVHSQSRWFFSYFPLAMISSIIFFNKLLNLITYKK